MVQVISIGVGSHHYGISIGADTITQIAQLLPENCAAATLIADDNVARLHESKLLGLLKNSVQVESLRFVPGEIHKARETKQALEDAMLARGLTRDTAVVAMGGGVTMDLAGFVAGTYLRGIPWIAVPTSLLAAVDASIGGKVGVNAPAGKNLIGLFHQPLGVIIDMNLIATLPPGEVDNGLAEMVKHGAIADRAYLDTLVSRAREIRSLQPDVLAPLIRRSVEIKAEVVSADPLEDDYRQVLNAGHTIAHALEAISDLRLDHGRAVAIGLSVEARIATLLGILASSERDALLEVLAALSLPTAVPQDLDPTEIVHATAIDKKGKKGRPRYVLLTSLGSVARGTEGIAREVEEQIVLEAIEETRQCSA